MAESLSSDRQSVAETAIALVAAVALIALVVLASGTQVRIYHPMWLDECITALVANDPSAIHGLTAIRGGVENNPPTYYLILWPIVRLFGGLGTVGLRLYAGGCTALAIVGVYSLCRLYVERERALIGALSTAAHPMVIAQMFEVRFYGLWLALTAWFAFSVLARRDGEDGWRVGARCVLAAAAATMHWFGIICVFLVVATDLLINRPGKGRRWVRALPFVAACAAVALFSPFLFAQRRGLTVPTWIEPTTTLELERMAYRIFVNTPAFILAAFIAWRLVRRLREAQRGVRRDDAAANARTLRATAMATAPALSLLAFPVVIAIFSLVVQPTLQERYILPGVIPLGLLTGVLSVPRSSRGGKYVLAAAGLALAISTGHEMRVYDSLVAHTDWRLDHAAATTARMVAQGDGRPIVFARRFEQYGVMQLRPDLARSIALIDFDGVPAAPLMTRTIFERDMARRVAQVYPQYRLINVNVLRKSEPFVVITSDDEVDELRLLLPGFDIVQEAPDVYYVTPPSNS